MAIEDKPSRTCELDTNGCLRLDQILNAFHAPIGEEQAWAICYQAAKCISKELVTGHPYCVSDISHVYIHKDGSVHEKTVYSTEYGPTREQADYEHEMVKSLGVVVFHALDFGLCEDYERPLGASLEALIERMTSSEEDDDAHETQHHRRVAQDDHPDEGIGLDEHHSTKCASDMTMATVIQMCEERLDGPTQADTHYKAVCRALVAEVLELSKFLEQVAMGTKELKQLHNAAVESSNLLEDLQVQDWARLWMQVIRELRQGVKLKKVNIDEDLRPIEYELTPYEMLLDDIRSRRYTLRKIMVNGNLPPRVKKDAHALILEFIRSRPPLVPVSKRKLAPAPVKQVSLYERLMASIRQQHKLKHVSPPTSACSEKKQESGVSKQQQQSSQPDQPRRRLIKPDLSLRLSISFDDDDDIEIPESPTEEKEPMSLPAMPLQEVNGHSPVDRRHSVPGYNAVERPTSLSMTGSRRKGRRRSPCSPSAQYYENYWTCSNWRSLECLSLTLEEVVHIRNVLTKAELEAVVGNRDMYEKLVKGKICFICKSKEFGLVLQRAKRCKLCERRVCDSCSVKMRVPTENFAKIPVYMLSPSPSPPHDIDPNSQPFFKMDSHKLESFEESFEASDSDEGECAFVKEQAKPQEKEKTLARLKKWGSFNEYDGSKRKKAPLERSKTISAKHDPLKDSYVDLKGPPACVCRDCKALVRHIIDTSQSKEPVRPKPSTGGPISCVSFCLSPLAESPNGGPSASQKILG